MFWLIATIVIVGASTALVSMRGQDRKTGPRSDHAQEKADFENRFPIVDYTIPESTDPQERAKRKSKDNRFPKGLLDELPNVTETSIADGNGAERLPALPIALSDTIIICDVLNGHAYLSSNRTGLFSEFTISVEEVLKTAATDPVIAGSLISVEREGGRIRYPSGRIRWVRFAHEGMPSIGGRYILFLRRTGQESSQTILTGYELRAGRVFPLDGVAEFEGSKLSQFASHERLEETVFVTTVRGLVN